MHDLIGKREGAGDDRLSRDDRGRSGEGNHGVERPFRHHAVERVHDGGLVRKHEGALTEIIDDEGGKDEE